ncbi:hypothetical protein ACHAXS_000430 [Conticribra weissflogii]
MLYYPCEWQEYDIFFVFSYLQLHSINTILYSIYYACREPHLQDECIEQEIKGI